MSSLLVDFQKIINRKTREYFSEVVSSYNNCNYRAAVVMLYTVAICDILYKLKDLSELYGDTNASELLSKYVKHQNGQKESFSKSSWEYDLLSDAKNAGLIDSVLFSELTTVYNYRNMSAHPILDQNYELCSPSKEITIALILAVFDRLLSQPPLYISKVIDSMSEDLAKRKSILLADRTLLCSSINDKYLSHLNEKYVIQVFKAFWKFCFILENEDCHENREINIEVLRLILEAKHGVVEKEIKEDPIHFRCSLNDECVGSLVVLLSEYPKLYNLFRKEDQTTINSFLNRNSRFKTISWFLFDSIGSFFDWLIKEKAIVYEDFFINKMNTFFEHNGKSGQLYDYYLFCYSESYSFESAKNRWFKLISPVVDCLSKNQLEQLIEIINNNSQIYNSYHSPVANNQIVKALLAYGQIKIDFSNYSHFVFDNALLSGIDDEEAYEIDY